MKKNMKFRTQFSEDRPSPKSNHGDRIHPVYGSNYDARGRLILEQTGEESIYDYIQSFKDSVDIHVILKRFQNGETDVLSKIQGVYGDFTQLPNDYASLLNTVNTGRSLFDSLAVDVRAKFGHDFNQFMSALCDGSINDILKVPPTEPTSSPTEPTPSPAGE